MNYLLNNAVDAIKCAEDILKKSAQPNGRPHQAQRVRELVLSARSSVNDYRGPAKDRPANPVEQLLISVGWPIGDKAKLEIAKKKIPILEKAIE